MSLIQPSTETLDSSIQPRLRRPLPAGRTYEQLYHHYLVERQLAKRLRVATRADRAILYQTMYDDLFRQVPDHPRLTIRGSSAETKRANSRKMALLKPHLQSGQSIIEWGCGDCGFATSLAREGRTVIGIDISDQRAPDRVMPPGFQLVLTDGPTVDLPDGTADLIFSDQLIEHLHPEDVADHFLEARRLLKTGGRYIVNTPQRLTGPHDVSCYFSNVAEGFHLSETSLTDLVPVLRDAGFSKVRVIHFMKGHRTPIPLGVATALEAVASHLPRSVCRQILRLALPRVTIEAS